MFCLFNRRSYRLRQNFPCLLTGLSLSFRKACELAPIPIKQIKTWALNQMIWYLISHCCVCLWERSNTAARLTNPRELTTGGSPLAALNKTRRSKYNHHLAFLALASSLMHGASVPSGDSAALRMRLPSLSRIGVRKSLLHLCQEH